MKKEELFTPINETNVTINLLLKIISDIYLNGGVLFYSFDVKNSKIFDSIIMDSSNIEELITHDEVLSSLTELTIELPLEVKPNFIEINIVDFKTKMINNLIEGGAYSKYNGNLNELNKIIEDFCITISDEHMNETKIYYSSKSWNKWFGDINWDSTYVFINKYSKKFYILCITDMD